MSIPTLDPNEENEDVRKLADWIDSLGKKPKARGIPQWAKARPEEPAVFEPPIRRVSPSGDARLSVR